MCMSNFRSGATLLLFTFFITVSASIAGASTKGTIGGKVVDPLGAVVPSADVTLLQNGKSLGSPRRTTKEASPSRRLTLVNTSSESKPPGSHRKKASPCILPQTVRSASK